MNTQSPSWVKFAFHFAAVSQLMLFAFTGNPGASFQPRGPYDLVEPLQPRQLSAGPVAGPTLADLVVDRGDDANVGACSSAASDCTLRGAINTINSLVAVSTTVRFDPSVITITIASSLPSINITGTQIQGDGGDPIINAAGLSSGDVLQVNANGVSISGLTVINGPALGGSSDIHIIGGFGVKIGDNYLGTLPESLGAPTCASGGVTRNSGYGLWVNAIEGHSGSNPVAWIYGNRVGCHTIYGLFMYGTDGTVVGQTPSGAVGRNYIGTNSNGTMLPNGVGLSLMASGSNGARFHLVRNNTIAHNDNVGIWLYGTGANDSSSTYWNIIAGNRVEHNGLTHDAGGLYLSNGAYFNVIGGVADADRNEIWGNMGNGISLFDSNANGILGNVVGNAAGLGAPNRDQGIYIFDGAINWVGGFFTLTGDTPGNVISGNGSDGVQITGGSTGTLLTHNKIGTNLSGTVAVPNANSGVAIYGGAHGNRIGDGTPAGSNVIGGNGAYGVYIAGSTTSSNTIAYNDIGLNSAPLISGPAAPRSLGLAGPAALNSIALPNQGDGVTLQDGTFGNEISSGTWIAHNGSGAWLAGGAHDNVIKNTDLFSNAFYGVLLEGSATTSNTVNLSRLYRNGYDGIGEKGGAHDNRWTWISTYDNGGLGIDRGITTNTGNTLTPNWPVITEVIPLGSTTLVRGLAGGTDPLHSSQVELYTVAPDPSGHGEGRTALGVATTDSSGVWEISVPAAGRCFTAFETDYAFIALGHTDWYSTEYGPNTCVLFLPVVRK